ncbi:MAG: hypothetical protein U0R44_01390 [Candidatus Micrarchaeia archaeon]
MGEERGDLINVEILSVGPLFRELDNRHLNVYLQRAPFFRHLPFYSALMS